MEHDIVFLHPPISFKKFHRPLFGVFDAQTGATELFLAMPVGLVNMAHQLRKAGYKTKVINVAELFKLQRDSFHLDGFLETLGFEECGRLKRVGRKFGRDFDVVYMQRFLDG